MLFPDIAKEWHPDKNTNLTPNDFTHGSDKKVWWLCFKGHSYDSRISNRTSLNRGCPYCSGRKKIEE
ncbi:MAG: zinc-ribbon domain-containing protein [Gammaproteobacteria bacterium]